LQKERILFLLVPIFIDNIVGESAKGVNGFDSVTFWARQNEE
jgi:hypothetical protein